MSPTPRLRPDVVVRKLTHKDESYVIVKDPERRKYYKFEEWEYDLLALLDGERSLEELARVFHEKHPEVGVDLQYMADYVEQLRRLDLLEKTQREKHLVMMSKRRALRKRRFYDAEGSTLFQIPVPLFDPDRFLNRVIPWIRWLWSPWVVGAWLVVFALVLSFLFRHWDLYWEGFVSLFNFAEKSLGGWIGFFVLLFGVSIWHELGHGFTCKRYGGEVHDIGIMLLYFQPFFYCGVDDSYLFPRLSHRVYVALGGAYFELMLCSVAAAVWLLTPAEWWIHTAAITVVFFTGLSAIVFNMNPFIRFDAYYVLMDWLNVPNLREESFEHVGNVLKRRLLRLKTRPRAISRRRRRIYLVYGTLSAIYTGMILWAIYTVLQGWFVSWVGPLGYLLALGVVGFIFRYLVRGFARFLRHLWLDKRELLRTGRGRVTVGLGIVLVGALLTMPRTATRIGGSFVVEPGERAVIRALADGLVTNVRVREGDLVEEGQVLAVMASPDLEAERRETASRVSMAKRRVAEAQRSGNLAAVREHGEEARGAESRLRLVERRLEGLRLTSPIRGKVTTPDLESIHGLYLTEGDLFCNIDRLDTVKLVVPMPELEIEEVRAGLPVRVLPTAYPYETLRAEILSVAPVAVPYEDGEQAAADVVRRTNLVRVEIEVINPHGRLRPGMTGSIRVLATPRSFAGRAWWRIRRWVSSVVW